MNIRDIEPYEPLTKQLSIRISEPQFEKLRKVSSDCKTKTNQLVRHLIRSYLNHFDHEGK